MGCNGSKSIEPPAPEQEPTSTSINEQEPTLVQVQPQVPKPAPAPASAEKTMLKNQCFQQDAHNCMSALFDIGKLPDVEISSTAPPPITDKTLAKMINTIIIVELKPRPHLPSVRILMVHARSRGMSQEHFLALLAYSKDEAKVHLVAGDSNCTEKKTKVTVGAMLALRFPDTPEDYAVGNIIIKTRSENAFENHQFNKAGVLLKEMDGMFVCRVDPDCPYMPLRREPSPCFAFATELEAGLLDPAGLFAGIFDHSTIYIAYTPTTPATEPEPCIIIGNGMRWFNGKDRLERIRMCSLLNSDSDLHYQHLRWVVEEGIRVCNYFDGGSASAEALRVLLDEKVTPKEQLTPIAIAAKCKELASIDWTTKELGPDFCAEFEESLARVKESFAKYEISAFIRDAAAILGDLKYDMSKGKELVCLLNTVDAAIDVQPYEGFSLPKDSTYVEESGVRNLLAKLTATVGGGVVLLVEGFTQF